ncbi:hypothetical protein F0562_021013 [Nyssa sinensis]|uniref:RING-type domain-containing protein n=1 Tax=Nyssa sinensis TaxID=561372 RepID=A0A5J5BP49_9ASTE|nr:hypothetical protein F0562_021013 [Nyssa sinensis]
MLRRNSSRVVSDTREDRLGQLIRRDRSFNSGENNAAEQAEQLRGVLFGEEMEEAPDTEEGVGETAEGPRAEAGGEQPRMSLMALLEETDRQMGLDGSTYMMDDEEEEEEKEEESGGRGELCSRELWVQRGNCPLCNGFILEILDIF